MGPLSKLVIIQHHCAGSSFIFHSLFSILSNVDIVAIQDPYLWNDIPLSAPGFSIIFPPVTNVQKVRVCLYISNRFISYSKVSFFPLFFNRNDICGVNFTFPSVYFGSFTSFTCINVYNRNRQSSDTHYIPPPIIFNEVSHPACIVGDFNIHHQPQNPSRVITYNQNAAAVKYFECATSQGFSAINTPGSFTRLPANSHTRPSIIDYTFLNHQAAPLLKSWSNNLPPTGSDHTAIQTTFNLSLQSGSYSRPAWDKVNWPPFFDNIKDVNFSPPSSSLDDWFQKSLAQITTPLLANTPRK